MKKAFNKSQIDQYEGLYGDHGLPDATFLFSELVETRSHNFDWNIKPHTHPGLYQLFFIIKGNFEFSHASSQQQLKGPCLLLIPPTALHGFKYVPLTKGRILSISDALLEDLFPKGSFLTTMFQNVSYLTEFPTPGLPAKLQSLMENIHEELFINQLERTAMLQACLQQLLITIYRIWQHQSVKISETDEHSSKYYRKFKQRIREVGTRLSISGFAADLGITPVHLNRICRKISDRSAGELVQEYTLEEAKKLLIYTQYTISEIAYQLNFDYPNYFARFFKKHTGLTPLQFRNRKP